MTNKELLSASVLDILFEHRNKAYGAYALRLHYPHRLRIALLGAFSIPAFFFLLPVFPGNEAVSRPPSSPKETIVLKEVSLLPEKPKEPEKPKVAVTPARPAKPLAARQYTSQIVLKPDTEAKALLPELRDLDDKIIGTANVKGDPVDETVMERPVTDAAEGNGQAGGPHAPPVDFEAIERQPEFPGGEEALKRFLAGNLRAPGELEEGEKVLVKIRFRVDRDGSVNQFEIIGSGGEIYDREVVRVFRKMPRWKPALQNGLHVAVQYMIPVTFVGAE